MDERSLPRMLRAMEAKLVANLEESRASFRHAGLRGGGVEASFREFLDSRLPRYLEVGTGEVIDTRDTRSGQTDVIIANEDQPIRSDRHDPTVFLIEGVAAAAEVKSRLTTSELDDSIAKGAKFKKLRNRYNVGDQIFSNEADRGRFYECPPYFLVAFESAVATETLISRLNNYPLMTAEDGSGQPLPALDAIFILGKGSAINIVEGGAFAFSYAEGAVAGQRAVGWVWQDRQNVLVGMFLWLNAVMPRVRRFGSIVLPYLTEHFSDPIIPKDLR